MLSKHIEVQHPTITHIKVTLEQQRGHATMSVFPVTLKQTAIMSSEQHHLTMTQWEDFTKTLEPMPRQNKMRLEQRLAEQIQKIEVKDETSAVYQLFQKCLTL
jgi:hypothetical protein